MPRNSASGRLECPTVRIEPIGRRLREGPRRPGLRALRALRAPARTRRPDRRVRAGARSARRARSPGRRGPSLRRRPMGSILTVGHSNRPLAEFLGILQAHGVARILDVRRYPVSRKWPHFDAAALSQSLAESGIDYAGLPELGGRRRPRPDSPHTAWREEGFRGYADFMDTS